MGDNIKLDNDKLNKSLEVKKDLPEVPRLEDGSIDLEAVSTGKNEKGNYIVSDEILKAYYKELPNGTVNESGTFTAWNRGLLQTLNDDIRRKGAEALNAERAQRRKLSETIDIFLKKKASIEEIEQLGLEEGATKQDAIIAAMMQKAIEKGDVAAGAFIRDTAGEKPTENISASVQMIPDQEKLLEEFNRIITE